MDQLPSIGDVYDLHVIGNDIAINACQKGFPLIGAAVDEVSVAGFGSCHEEVAFTFSFVIGDAGIDGGFLVGELDILSDLAVQVALTIIAGNQELTA